MIIAKKALPRRTVLRGMGSMLALPLLDSMMPALVGAADDRRQAHQPLQRHVCAQRHDHEELSAADRRRIVRAHADIECAGAVSRRRAGVERARVHPQSRTARRRARESEHAVLDRRLAANQRDLARRRDLDGPDPRAGDRASRHSWLRSSSRSSPAETAGACDTGFACPYTNTISWKSQNTPLPTQNNPRVVFERLFGDSHEHRPQCAARPTPSATQRARFGR